MKTQIYIHIPKTAGTFVRNALASKYKDIGFAYGTPPHSLISQKDDLAMREFKLKSAVIGHEDYKSFRDIFSDNADYSTLMRNPVDRLISYYNHAMANFPGLRDRPVSLLKFLENSNNYEIDNLQLRYLSGKSKMEKVGPADLDNAKSLIHMGKINVGILENLDEALNSMPIFLGITKGATTQKINVSSRGLSRSSIADAELDKLRSVSRLDLQLYRFCRQEIVGNRRVAS